MNTIELLRMIKACAGDEKKLNLLGLGKTDGETYLRLYGHLL